MYSGFMARNSIAFVPLAAYFLGQGFSLAYNYYLWAIPIIMLLYAFYISRRGYPVFLTKRIEQAKSVAEYIDTLPNDGVMCEGLSSQALAYHSKKRIIVLPRTPDKDKAMEQINLSIKVFNLNYIVISEFWRTEKMLYPAIEYIKNNPQRFELINTITEQYDTTMKSDLLITGDRFYIYRII